VILLTLSALKKFRALQAIALEVAFTMGNMR